jgi:hypothetical protein
MRPALFWDFTQRRMLLSYWCFETTYRSHLKGQARPLKMGPMECPDLSVKIYSYKLRKMQKIADSCIFSTRITSSKSRVCMIVLVTRQRGRLSSQCDTQRASVLSVQASLVSQTTPPAVNFQIYFFKSRAEFIFILRLEKQVSRFFRLVCDTLK